MHKDAMSATVLGCLLEPALAGLAAQLGRIGGLSEAEREIVRAAAGASALETVRLKTNRVLLLELNAARITGRLTGPDPRARWQEWEARASTRAYWDSLGEHYPTLLPRLERLIAGRCAAALSLAARFAADRHALAPLTDGGGTRELTGGGTGELTGGGTGVLTGIGDTGELIALSFGAGDSHRGGQTVAMLACASGVAVYKPRSVAVDVALARLLAAVLQDEPAHARIAVPDVVPRDGYGWARHVEHRYCDGERELRLFYRNLGHWLAVMRLLGGSDLHAENLVAAGPVPTVVDCETLFTPRPTFRPTGYGLAPDRAALLVGGSVLGTGLLPGRGLALGWRGVDTSAIGSLPGQQPVPKVPVIVDAGTDAARIEHAEVPVPAAVNHPSPEPVLGAYWDEVVAGFTGLSERLRRMDRAGELEPLVAEFGDLPIRVVPRSTETYAELGRMLWHPRALHDEPAARRRAASLLARQAASLPGRPDDPAVIAAEIEELLDGDVPFFATTPRKGRLTGPRGTTWGCQEDLVEAALGRWRAADLSLDRQVIQCALVSAYLNEGWLPDERRLLPSKPAHHDLDGRRRRLAAGMMRKLAASAIRAEDGTATWIAPVLNRTGWAVLPLGLDLYGGIGGVAVLLAAYQHETERGRADPVPGLRPLLTDVLRTMRTAEDRAAEHPVEPGGRLRPDPVGGYLGLGSRIWGWLLLHRLGAVGRHEACARAAGLVPEIAAALRGTAARGSSPTGVSSTGTDPADIAVTDDVRLDLVAGMAGAVVPLLRLAEHRDHHADEEAEELAIAIGRHLVARARTGDGTAWWENPGFPDGLGGLAHGVTGIGWALSRLAETTGDATFAATAEAAFAHEETLYALDKEGWLDIRQENDTAAAWCHGAAGIGIAAADLMNGDPRWSDVLRRAATACHTDGLGWNHTLCHGDLGAWELLDHAITRGLAAPGLDRHRLDAHVLSSLEEHGPVSGFARDAFPPSLLPGLGGVAYQLLRMHPDSTLPSVLLPDPGPAHPTSRPTMWRRRPAG
ncbi:type 2 lanthipeptide synthetase LanM family protein [Nonomuraea gerenzanensis]|uniref:Lanthionine biosynthesis protein LanM n=1 Tax=Nonomuraea gerenzanensis TaxID=93944 RepID=A0A1M4EJ38_9ACTN|nr:type 2 lanthipeptide synthetase LanM family protein [Nonomuraea gerenzanensis]UBU10321.1 type 2 lantipeptide synthetase LanM family protein [Nonomuraea gerenzanensis]SBO98708.1 Lanthionine biosynthesis protein LanM [Nonomuraea gerenzanensis]